MFVKIVTLIWGKVKEERLKTQGLWIFSCCAKIGDVTGKRNGQEDLMYGKKKSGFLRRMAVLCACALLVVPMEAKADAITGRGSNVERQNYVYNWASPIESYITYMGDGTLMRVQACDGGVVLVEYYDSAYHKGLSLTIPAELPLFGGFYAMNGCYYIVSGQNNPQQSNDTEVYRVTKYDSGWNRLGSAGLYGANTVIPFDAGSLRFAQYGKYLLVRTCHEMYRSDDGLNHQANVTFQVDTESMRITDSLTEVSNDKMGYVSHSFNQFIAVDGNRIVAVDHGDAYPRSIVLLKYKTDVSAGKFKPDYWENPCESVDLLKFPGSIGDNFTGATIGGFQVLDGGYVAVGSSVSQGGGAISGRTKNIFVASVPKGGSAADVKWLTNYPEGDSGASTPQLVKVSGNQAVLLWSNGGIVCYMAIDGSGNAVSGQYALQGSLSDCAPVVAGDKIVWYTWENDKVTFYEINLNDLSIAGVH